jgi:hypothetical protein
MEERHSRWNGRRVGHFTISDGPVSGDENGTEIFRINRFRFLYYEPFFNMKNC